jgi:hypothetical protein
MLGLLKKIHMCLSVYDNYGMYSIFLEIPRLSCGKIKRLLQLIYVFFIFVGFHMP